MREEYKGFIIKPNLTGYVNFDFYKKESETIEGNGNTIEDCKNQINGLLPTIAVWFSCGAASAVAAKKTVEMYGKYHDVLIVNNPIKEEDSDNIRFMNDVSKWIGKEIITASNKDYPNYSIVEIFEKRQYMSGVKGAPCTNGLNTAGLLSIVFKYSGIFFIVCAIALSLITLATPTLSPLIK